MQSCRHRCHFHPLVPSTHLRSEGLLELEDLLYVFRLLFPGGAALAVLPGHGRLARWGSRGCAGEGAPGARRERRGMPGAGMQSRRMRSAGRLRLRQSFLFGSFLFRLGCCRRGPSLALISTALRHRLPASAAACQPHFLLLSCLAPAPSPPPAPLPQPASSRGLPALPVHPAASPPPARRPSGMSRSPPQERRALGAGVLHLTTGPRTLRGCPRTLSPPARMGGRNRQVPGAGTRGGALAFRELYYEVKAGGARAFPLRAGGGASAWRSEAPGKVGMRGSWIRGAQGGVQAQELVAQACCAGGRVGAGCQGNGRRPGWSQWRAGVDSGSQLCPSWRSLSLAVPSRLCCWS